MKFGDSYVGQAIYVKATTYDAIILGYIVSFDSMIDNDIYVNVNIGFNVIVDHDTTVIYNINELEPAKGIY
jgi:hypothetical protein